MGKFIAVLIGGFLNAQAMAGVTPAYLAGAQVKAFLEGELEQQVEAVLPPHKAATHVISVESNFFRGKYCPGGFSDFTGSTTFGIVLGASNRYYTVSCAFSARAEVVPFAMQMVPILEEVINGEQLILRDHSVSCSLVE